MEQLPDDVPYDVKQRRNNLLLEIQNEISEQENQRFVGQTVEVLVEGQSKKSAKQGEEGPIIQLVGRTPCDRIVVFDGTERQVGQILPVTVYDTTPHTLLGSVMTEHTGPELYLLGSS
jgi:tRNA-2-methylthio-N6-dimethylallyladenosine synthase